MGMSLSGDDGGALLAWYDREKRKLPWRNTNDPYAVWVSEIMLQQTQVTTVLPFWHRWMETFPTVESLAEADEQAVLSIWQGLGYYRRCRKLLQGARWVVQYGFPTTPDGWLKVPGVGRYTAGAISSIAFGAHAPVVDGNVERVYARLTGDDGTDRDLNLAAWEWAKQNLFLKRPGDWNQSLMELGAVVCKPISPDCDRCPLATQCVAKQSWRVDDLPTKMPQLKIVKMRNTVWVPVFENQIGLRQIASGQWWEGMWEFPRAEWIEDMEHPHLREIIGQGWVESVGVVRHSVTNHRITIDVSFIRCKEKSSLLEWFEPIQLESLPMPAPQRRILNLILSTKSVWNNVEPLSSLTARF